ncbi:MAG: 2Fe-2S iron-sulfur cluster binding domain-containing protein [Hahellaceae bacterium]|nr:2Fe-2S iron-sulfur cluster binding domain-containing protein [Hahellaceae bacterium]MCP5212541.1 2Fe-2S iron-sulfur cluster binding domain-containing protein [Hahellaceae bacterium]
MSSLSVEKSEGFADFMRSANHWLGKKIFNTDSVSAYFEPIVQLVSPMWSAGECTAKVLDIYTESKDIFTLRLTVSNRWGGFVPGQFVGITVNKNGTRLTRYFSVSSAPALWRANGIVEFTIRRQASGVVTNWIPEHLYAGSQVSISPAMGEFTYRQKNEPALFIAGGSGITPFRSILQDLSDTGSVADVHLLYYCDGPTHLFKTEWTRIQMRCPGIKVTFIDALAQGRFGTAHLFEFVPDFHLRDIYICGPGPMISAVRETLKKERIDDERVFFEFFGAAPMMADSLVEAVPDSVAKVVFQQSGKIVTTVDKPATLLEMAESAGLSPVTGCRMGVCHQCICQKSSGRVLNTLTGKTSDNGAGEVQLCVSVPVSDVTLAL